MNPSQFRLKPADLKEYVDIHGRNVRVELSPTGEYLIPLCELKPAGFTVIVKSQYNRLLVDESDFTNEFHEYMLGAAKSWCLSNKHSFTDHEIVQSIENAKRILLGEHTKKATDPPKSEFLRDRSVADDGDLNIQITKTTSVSTPKHVAPSQTPHHVTPAVRPLTSQNLQLHNEQKLPPVNVSNGNRTPPTIEAISDGNSFDGNKGSFQGRKSFEQNNQNNYQRRSADSGGQFNQRRSNDHGENRNSEGSGGQFNQRRSNDFGENRNADGSGSQFGQRKSGGGDYGGNQFNQRTSDNSAGQYGQRKSGGGDNAGQFNQRNTDNNGQFGQRRSGGGDSNQSYQKKNCDDQQTPTMRLPHQRPDNQDGQNMPRMPQKGAYNRPPYNNNNNKERENQQFPKIEMDKGENKVVVTHVEGRSGEKSNYSIWVQRLSHLPTLVDITNKVNTLQKTQAPVQPQLHKVYMAMHEGDWYRCRVCGLEPTQVFFTDYGNKAIVDEVKPLPEELAKIPQQAVKVTLIDGVLPPNIDDEVTLIVEKVFANSNVHVARIKKDNACEDNTATNMMSKMSLSNSSPQSTYQQSPPKPQQRQSFDQQQQQQQQQQAQKPPPPVMPSRPAAYFGSPRPVVELRSEMQVKIMGEQLGCFYLLTREGHEEQRAIMEEISQLKLSPAGAVTPDQLVLCCHPTSKAVCRAIVLKLFDATAKVQLLDSIETFQIPVDSLKAITESLSKRPTTLLKSSQIMGYTKPYGDSVKEHLHKCIASATKFKTHLHPTGEFDLKQSNGELLSRTLQKLEAPGRVMLSDLKEVTLQFKTNEPFLCASFVSIDQVTFIHQTTELIDLIDHVLISELADNTPYVPIVNEVCLGCFEDSWYRCTIRGIKGDSYSVHFIDFGNELVLSSNELRKLTEDLLDIPILGSEARLIGITKNAKNEKALREKISDEVIFLNVISFTDGKYNVEIPTVYEEIGAQ